MRQRPTPPPPQFSDADLDERFSYHPPIAGSDQQARYEQLRADARSLAGSMRDAVPAGCELALALTNLEQAVMHANAGIARAGGA